MPVTSVDVPDDLLDRAMRTLGATTKREAIVVSLEAVVQRGEQLAAIEALAAMPHLADLADPEIRAQARR